MSTKCRTCDKVCSYRTEDYVPEYAALQARHNALVEAIVKYLDVSDTADMAAIEGTLTMDMLSNTVTARAEVDRLLEEK